MIPRDAQTDDRGKADVGFLMSDIPLTYDIDEPGVTDEPDGLPGSE